MSHNNGLRKSERDLMCPMLGHAQGCLTIAILPPGAVSFIMSVVPVLLRSAYSPVRDDMMLTVQPTQRHKM